MKDGEEDVEVAFIHPDRAKREKIPSISVIYGGAVDFDGNKRDFKKRYPDIYAVLKKRGLLK